jgi:hypothetical protein
MNDEMGLIRACGRLHACSTKRSISGAAEHLVSGSCSGQGMVAEIKKVVWFGPGPWAAIGQRGGFGSS